MTAATLLSSVRLIQQHGEFRIDAFDAGLDPGQR